MFDTHNDRIVSSRNPIDEAATSDPTTPELPLLLHVENETTTMIMMNQEQATSSTPEMGYHLLTGGTGLLGRYLIKDLSQAGVKLAVLVRPSRRQTAQERVESILQFWEQELGTTLPRPVVLSGDLTDPDLGLSAEDIKWASENCTHCIHNAASLSFVSTSRESEPWKSNVGGTNNVIDFCRQAGIKQFHHVSTAYVAGLREGVCLETELNVGQKFGNDYEQSKVMAEEAVRNESFFDQVTVHRPAIIIGDSENGFTNTFHGFYAAVQLCCTISKSQTPNETGVRCDDIVRLNLDGFERKNLVPVDWVSAAMSHIISNPEHHGQTYHLTPRHAVEARTILNVVQVVGGFYGTQFVGPETVIDQPTELETLFFQHFEVYNSYWRNDPVYDSTNTQKACPHLPCPHVDYEMLLRLSRIAQEMNFQFREHKIVKRDKPKVAAVN